MLPRDLEVVENQEVRRFLWTTTQRSHLYFLDFDCFLKVNTGISQGLLHCCNFVLCCGGLCRCLRRTNLPRRMCVMVSLMNLTIFLDISSGVCVSTCLTKDSSTSLALFWTDPDAELASGEPLDEDSAWRNCATDSRTGLMGAPPSRLLSPETGGDSLTFSKIRVFLRNPLETSRITMKIALFQGCLQSRDCLSWNS